MNIDQKRQLIEDQVADFCNGHLNEAETQVFEDILRQEPSLKELVTMEKTLIQRMQDSVEAEIEAPSFASFADRLEDKKASFFSGWQTLGTAITACVFVVAGLIVVPQLTTPQGEEYVTLTDQAQEAARPTLNIVILPSEDGVNLDKIAEEYQLTISKRYPRANAADVLLDAGHDAEELAAILEKDDRVRFVEIK